VVVVSVTMPVTIPWMTKTLLRETVCHSDQKAIAMREIGGTRRTQRSELTIKAGPSCLLRTDAARHQHLLAVWERLSQQS
jgi:hypothetical protein